MLLFVIYRHFKHHYFSSPVTHHPFHLSSQVKSLSLYSLVAVDSRHLCCTYPRRDQQQNTVAELWGDCGTNVLYTDMFLNWFFFPLRTKDSLFLMPKTKISLYMNSIMITNAQTMQGQWEAIIISACVVRLFKTHRNLLRASSDCDSDPKCYMFMSTQKHMKLESLHFRGRLQKSLFQWPETPFTQRKMHVLHVWTRPCTDGHYQEYNLSMSKRGIN